MRVCTSLIVLLAVFICGCSSEHFKTGRGDVGQFILQQAIIRGGSPVDTNALPAISTRWRYSTDKYGVVVRMPREEFGSVEDFLRQAFGKPTIEPTETSKLGVYRLSSKGGAIQFVSDTNWTQVIVIRPISEHEWDTDIMPKTMKAFGESR